MAKKIDNSVLITLIIVTGVLVMGIMIFAFANSTIYAKTISSTGTATIKVVPDLVVVYFNIQTQGKTSIEAGDENSE
ncbi:MAG: SIMPL domain-containing protein, partial [Nanoarchaeota archaeon]